MIKKIFTFGLLLGLLTVCSTANAQDQEYPRYGFWSNWSIGASIDLIKQGEHGWDWPKGINMGFSVMAEKELNHVWTLRLTGMVPTLFNDDSDTPNDPISERNDLFAAGMVGFKFSITNAIMGYDTSRRASIYLLGMGGVSYRRDDVGITGSDFSFAAAIGGGYSYKICKKSTIFVEGLVMDHASVRNIFDNHLMIDAMISVGYLYNFGLTKADRERQATEALMSAENLAALQNSLDEANRKIENKDKEIKRIKDDLKKAQDDLKNRPVANVGNSAAADSLQKLVDQIKEDQVTYYALPFSVLFDFDQYTVNDSEMEKIAAVAKVMKSTDANFTVRGFCDKVGKDSYNQKLAQRRAEKVVDILVKKYGVDKSRLTIVTDDFNKYFGDGKYAINRRVSFYRVIE